MSKAIIKLNGGYGALLCNECYVIIREGFDPDTIEDREHLCPACTTGKIMVLREGFDHLLSIVEVNPYTEEERKEMWDKIFAIGLEIRKLRGDPEGVFLAKFKERNTYGTP